MAPLPVGMLPSSVNSRLCQQPTAGRGARPCREHRRAAWPQRLCGRRRARTPPRRRDHRRGRGVPAAIQLRQRQHRRPAGPPGDRRAGWPAGHPHRARRHHHRARRPLGRKAPQQPQWRGRARRRLDLVHRPQYGIDSDYEGYQADSESGASHVYRLDPTGGRVQAVARDFAQPNGLAFSPDERQLYVADTPRGHIRRFGVEEDGRLTGGDVFATCDAGRFDGLRLDAAGRVWAAAHDGLHCFHRTGRWWASCLCPRSWPTLPSGDRDATTCSSAPPAPCTRCR
jgi:SMP-30/Gluconolactonase/LRE-like region